MKSACSFVIGGGDGNHARVGIGSGMYLGLYVGSIAGRDGFVDILDFEVKKIDFDGGLYRLMKSWSAFYYSRARGSEVYVPPPRNHSVALKHSTKSRS